MNVCNNLIIWYRINKNKIGNNKIGNKIWRFKGIHFLSLIQNHSRAVLLNDVLKDGVFLFIQNHLLAVLVPVERGGGGSEV